jgi:hypothetical protein
MSGRPWTKRENAILRRWYGRRPAVAIAAQIGRTGRAVSLRAGILGFAARNRRFSGADHRRICRLVRAGSCNCCIARALGSHRQRIRDYRRQCGLPPVASLGKVRTCESCRLRFLAGLRRQFETWGVSSLGELRAAAYLRFAAASGWPADLRPRAIQVLDALWEHGPQTRRQLAEAIGMPWKGSRRSLHSNDPEGSYLAHLQARGLVASLGRVVRGVGRGRSVQLYSIAPGVVRGERCGYESKRSKTQRRRYELVLQVAGDLRAKGGRPAGRSAVAAGGAGKRRYR